MCMIVIYVIESVLKLLDRWAGGFEALGARQLIGRGKISEALKTRGQRGSTVVQQSVSGSTTACGFCGPNATTLLHNMS